MPQSLACIHIHLIFSTKNRQRWLKNNVRDPLHRYIQTVLQNLECPALIINSAEDHVHILFQLNRTISLSIAVEEVKKSSSRWIKNLGTEYLDFSWQGGYGAFSVSASNIETVRSYIADQETRHKELSFQDELLAFFKKHKVKYNEQYLWD